MPSLTLIVPTYNRPELLERCLHHFNLDECALPIVIADGSGPEGRSANARSVAALGADLDLIHAPYPPELGFAARCAVVLGEVTTPLVAFHADDDFMLSAGLLAAAERLDADPGLVAAQGSMLLARREDPAVRVMPYLYEDVIAASPMARLHEHLRNYRPTFYSVHRRWSALRSFELIAPFADWWPRMIEVGLSSVIALNGPFRHVDALQGVRETHAGSESGRDRKWPGIVTDPKFSTVLDAYAAVIAAEAAQHPQAAAEAEEVAADRDAAARMAFLEFLKCALVPSRRPRTRAQIRQSWAAHDLFAEGRMTPALRQSLQTIFLSLG